MAKSVSRYERLETMERMLVRQPNGCTTKELATELHVDTDTIRRDIVELQSMGTGLYKEGHRYLLDHRRSLHTIKMTNDELIALFLATRLLSRHSDEHNPHVVRALEKLADGLRSKSPQIAQHIDRTATAVRNRRTRPAYVEALEAITQGWVEQRKVWIRYRNEKGKVSERIFAPYFIEPSGIGYACHVIGWDDQSDEMRTFKIERVSQAQVKDERYVIPSEFDPQRLLANAWGVIWRDANSIEVVLHFSPNVAERVKESMWHHSQQITELPDGGCLYIVQVGSTMEMKPWVRGWGADVTVLKPAELRADIAAEARRTAANYTEEQVE